MKNYRFGKFFLLADQSLSSASHWVNFLLFLKLGVYLLGVFLTASVAQAQLLDLFKDTSSTAPEEVSGFRVEIRGKVNGALRNERLIKLESSDQIQLLAHVTRNGNPVTLDQLQKSYEITFSWYRIVPSSNVFIDPRAMKYFSPESQEQYTNYAPFVPKKLEYTSEFIIDEEQGELEPSEVQDKNEVYYELNQRRVGALRFKVILHLTHKSSERHLAVSSPDERRLSKAFPNLKTAETSQVFLISRRGNSGFPVLDEALSYLGLPYIWWTGAPSRMLGLTCSQLVGVAAFNRDISTAELHSMKGIEITQIKKGRFYGLVQGKEVPLKYGAHVKPGFILVYYDGKEDRHAAMLAEDHGGSQGFLDSEDMMIHSTVSGLLGGNFFKRGLEYTQLGEIFNEDTLGYKIKIITTGKAQ